MTLVLYLRWRRVYIQIIREADINWRCAGHRDLTILLSFFFSLFLKLLFALNRVVFSASYGVFAPLHFPARKGRRRLNWPVGSESDAVWMAVGSGGLKMRNGTTKAGTPKELLAFIKVDRTKKFQGSHSHGLCYEGIALCAWESLLLGRRPERKTVLPTYSAKGRNC